MTITTISSTSGNITLQGQGGAAGGHGILLTGSSVGQTGSGHVLLAGQGTGGLADIAWDSLTLQKSGGTYTFQDTVEGGQLLVLPGPYQVLFLDGGLITGPVTFQNSGGVVLGNEISDQITFAGGLTSTAGPTTLQGTVVTQGTPILLGSTTLDNVRETVGWTEFRAATGLTALRRWPRVLVLVVLIELGQITPPMGLNIFVIQGISGESLLEVVRGVWPYAVLMLLAVVLLALFPGLATWLPAQMVGP